MLRIVAALYLMIVTAAGPAACCCTLTRLTARFAPAAPTVPQAPACCHHTPAGQDSTGGTGRHGPSDCPDGPGCPCKEGGLHRAEALPSAQDEAHHFLARISSTLLDYQVALPLDQVAEWAAASSFFRDGATALPLSTDDLLYAFHILRC